MVYDEGAWGELTLLDLAVALGKPELAVWLVEQARADAVAIGQPSQAQAGETGAAGVGQASAGDGSDSDTGSGSGNRKGCQLEVW